MPEHVEIEPAPAPPMFWATSLSDYNDGELHGAWIEASDDVDAMWEQINDMLAQSPTAAATGEAAEEWRIDDQENWGSIRLHEYEDIDTIATLAGGLIEHGEAFAGWVTLVDRNDATAIGNFEDNYLGQFTSREEHVEQMLDDMGISPNQLDGIPENLHPYIHIDIEGLARDMELNGEIVSSPCKGGVHLYYGY